MSNDKENVSRKLKRLRLIAQFLKVPSYLTLSRQALKEAIRARIGSRTFLQYITRGQQMDEWLKFIQDHNKQEKDDDEERRRRQRDV